MRVFIASLATETNTFAPFPTSMADFEEYGVRRDMSQVGEGPLSGPLRVFRQAAKTDNDEIIESLSAFAQPSGKTVRAVYEKLRDAILADLAAAGPVDIVLLMLHGAMVAEGYDDCEGDIIDRVRAIAPDAVVGVELDLHCHLSDKMVGGADIVIACKEYPHIDFGDRARELYALCRRAALGEIRPVAALVDTGMIGFYPTFDPPMSKVVAELWAMEAKPGILAASIAHGFPWGDVTDIGTRVLVYADDDADAAAVEALQCARGLYALRHALAPDYPGIADSLNRARGLKGRVVLGDFADNPGGGAPGDSTFFLRAILERGLSDVVIGCFWDPAVANVAAGAGVGAKIQVRLGGKSGPASGDPLDLAVEVKATCERHSQGAFGSRQPLGRSAWLRCGGVDIVVCSIRTQVFEPDAFTGLGIALDDKRLIVVKSSTHYQAGFRSHADHLWNVRSPGALSLDFATFSYTKRDGDYFPKIDDPWAARGEPRPSIFSQPVR